MAEWAQIPFEEVAPSRLGKMLDGKKQTGRHARPYLRNENVQWGRFDLSDVSTMDFDESDREEFLLSPGDLIICEGGEPGRSAIWRGEIKECYFQKALHRARPIASKAIPEYLLYVMWWLARSGGLKDHVTSATIAHLTGEKLKQVLIPVPPLSEQRGIAGRLEQADRLRRTRRYALDLSATILPAAFLKIFGDPGDNPHAYDRVQVENLFSLDRDGVKCGPFGSALKKHEYVASGVPVWTMNNVGENAFTEDGCLFITPDKFSELSAYDVRNDDILISRAGTVGRMAIVHTRHECSIIHSNLIRLSLNPARILPIYFVGLMTWFATRVARLKRGQEDAYTFMSTGSLGELQVPLPPISLQQKFAALVERVEGLRAVQREALRQAEHLFASLLHQAFAP